MPLLGETLALTTGLVWAGAVILFKKSGDGMAPLGLSLFKNVVAGIPALLTVLILGDLLYPALWGWDGIWLLLSGALGLGIGDTLFLASLSRLGASRSAIVSSLYSPCIIVVSYFLLGETLTHLDYVGGALIIGSILILAREGKGPATMEGASPRNLAVGIAYGALAVAIMGISIVCVKPILEQHPLVWSGSVRLVGGILALSLIAFISRDRRQIARVFRPAPIWKIAIPASLLGSYIAMICWIGGFKHADAGVVSLLNQTSMVFTVILAAVFLNERLTRLRILALLLAAAGSVLVIGNWGEKPESPGTTSPTVETPVPQTPRPTVETPVPATQ